MTEALFQTDSYLKEFTATVIASESIAKTVVLNRTVFYASGGGQPHDTGCLEANDRVWSVLNVKRRGDQIVHSLDREPPVVGSQITGTLDWQRRYQLMRTHTALHILCGVVWRDYGALVTGGNMEPLSGRMDFEFETLQQHLIQAIETKINNEVQSKREIRVKILPRAEAFQIPDLIRTKINLLPAGITQVRTIEIVGLDLQADGGTHVANTREVGKVRIVNYHSKGKSNKRIYLELDA